ncbi:MAG: outer membrane protein beta-barrel domain [Gammaproteobacteria bacterium]|jgi:opacity protein-like surface antigen|nr:outer membrane protein beta-barrel domain [Gammaproteobacteria bacterium]
MNKLKTLALITALAIPIASQAQTLTVATATFPTQGQWTHQWYGGVGAGWQHDNLQTNMNNIYLHNDFHAYQFNATNSSAFLNLFAGLANQIDKNYWAVEADAYYDDTHNDTGFYEDFSSTTHNMLSQMPWRFELDGIYGRYFNPQTLIYGKIGFTTGELQGTYYAYTPDGTVTGDTQAYQQLYGGVVGLGVQYALDQNWRIGAEADYVNFFNTTAQTNTVYRNFNPNSNESFDYKNYLYMVKAYVSYYF